MSWERDRRVRSKPRNRPRDITGATRRGTASRLKTHIAARLHPEVTDESEKPQQYAVLEVRALRVTINYRVTTINHGDAKPGEAAIA